jgi:sugar diacid utilization regulator
MLARVGDTPQIDAAALSSTVAESRAGGRAVRRDGSWVAAVAAGQQHLGALLLAGRTSLDDADQHILERAAMVTALLLLARRSGAEAANRVRGELVDDLLRRPDVDPVGLAERARRLGADLDAAFGVFVADVGGADRQRAALAANHLATTRTGLAGSFEGRLVLLLPVDGDVGAVARGLAGEFGSVLGHPVTVGGAGPSVGVASIEPTYREASRCVAALRTLGREGQGAGAGELGFIGLVLSAEPDIGAFVDATMGEILRWDDARGTDLLGTLESYFGAGGNLARASAALHVHVNTVTQRLQRIGHLLGDDWQQPGRLLELQLALRLHRLTDSVT